MEEFPDPSLENNEKRKKIILEIGTGANPAIGEGGRYKEKLSEGNHIFVALDIDMLKLQKLKERMRWMDVKDIQEKVLIVNADGKKGIPLRKNSVDEVILRNVLGDLNVNSSLDSKGILPMINNINQILKPHGRLVIIETLTPDYAKGIGSNGHYNKSQDYRNILENYPDLKLAEHSKVKEIVAYYSGRSSLGGTYPFVTVYEKKSSKEPNE
jgi:hypothetical protein